MARVLRRRGNENPPRPPEAAGGPKCQACVRWAYLEARTRSRALQAPVGRAAGREPAAEGPLPQWARNWGEWKGGLKATHLPDLSVQAAPGLQGDLALNAQPLELTQRGQSRLQGAARSGGAA